MSSIRSILEDSIHYTLKSSALFPAENPIYANIIDQALKEIEEAIDIAISFFTTELSSLKAKHEKELELTKIDARIDELRGVETYVNSYASKLYSGHPKYGLTVDDRVVKLLQQKDNLIKDRSEQR